MNLHFDEPLDKTRNSSAVFEFFCDDLTTPTKLSDIKGKSIQRVIEEKKISNYYKKRIHLDNKLQILESIILVGVIFTTISIVIVLYALLN